VRPHWPVVNEALRDALAQVSLTRLAGPTANVQAADMTVTEGVPA